MKNNIKEVNLTSNEPVDEFHVLVKIFEALSIPYNGNIDCGPIDADVVEYHYNLSWDDDVFESELKNVFKSLKVKK